MTEQIERELVLPAPPGQVWDVITAPGWLAEDVQLDLVPGGEASFGSGGDVKRGWVEEAVAPHPEGEGDGRLAFWWATDGEPATRVELTLEPEGDGGETRLHIVESRPLEVLDVTGIPLPGAGGSSYGPAMVAVA
ncbi:MAG TPA: SRPBCC domain-containing protein [Solirubrobacteraceae bacterium]|nr:SRPBCC domain-containing protein [Solirubrobacteraceae bacterium]